MLKLIYRYVHVMAALLVSVTMAAQNGYDPDSPVEPGDVSIDTPVISQQRGMISIACATSDVTIYYTIDVLGNEGQDAGVEDIMAGNVYSAPFNATANTVIKAVAVNSHYQSEVAKLNVGEVLCFTPVIAFNEPKLEISTPQNGVTIRYTVDGSNPTLGSMVYSGALDINEPCTVKAIAEHELMATSEVAVYDIKRCDAVGYEYSENQYLVLTCATEKSTIHYMLEGNPEALYEDVLTLSDNRPVRFWATADGWLSSDTIVFTPGNFVCDNLVIAFHEPNLTISGGGEGAIIYYTTDGSLPTADSRIYNGTLEITDTCIVSAVAMRDGFHPSEVAVYEVKRCAAVGYEYSDSQYLALVCATPESSIRYVPEEYPEALYEDVLTLSDNRPIRFWATADGWLSSDIGTFTPDNFTCGPVHVYIEGGRVFAVDEQNDHEVRLLANNETVAGGMSLCETSVDEAMQAVYGSETVAPLTFMAVSTHPYKHEVESEVVELPAYSRMDDDVFHIHVFIPGQAETIDWHASSCDIRHLALHGMLATSDYQYVCRLNPLVLNLNDVHSEMPNRALASCSNLAALIWDEPQTSGEWSLGTGNPNTIFYTTSSGSLPADANIVMNGVAQIVTLADGGNFYCPQPFEARRISYTHKYEQTTGDGYAAGWETLALPFDVQSIWHVDRHVEIMSLEALAQYIQPYDAGENSIMPKPFWLMEMGNDTWKRATGIKAGMPYIISMPNNDKYVSSSRLNGWVSFRAENVMVPATEQTAVEVGDFSFVPTTCVVERSSDIYVLNAYDESDTNVKPGSAFLAGWRDVSPFQAYIVSHGTQQNMFSIASIRTVAAAADAIVAAAADLEGVSRIYTIGGVAVRTATAPGLYIVNGKKVFVR